LKKRSLLLLVILACAVPGAPLVSRAAPRCQVPSSDRDAYTNRAPKTQNIPAFHGLKGHYALPKSSKPKTLVVMFHGYGNSSDSWVCHLLDAAQNHGVVAVAMDYRGTGWAGPDGKAKPSDNRGWFVREGAADSIFAAKYFLKRYPSIKNVVDFSISMGSNAGGLAVAAGATRPGSSKPLFDYWVNVEGATSMIETYHEALLVALSGNTTAVNAQQDIEKECGGTPADNPSCYQDLTVLFRTPDIAATGLKGVVAVHGLDDGLVPHNQSEEMTAALRLAGVPTDYYIALRRNDWQNPASAQDQGGTVLSTNVFGPVFSGAGETYPAPLAGHGWEGSNTQIVTATAFAKLWSLLEHHQVPANHQYFVDGDLGVQQVF
jgi:pimeloyl-ACP methyl ester carboxylesterase